MQNPLTKLHQIDTLSIDAREDLKRADLPKWANDLGKTTGEFVLFVLGPIIPITKVGDNDPGADRKCRPV